MMRRYNRLLVAFYVITDALLGMAAFVIAYLLRFETWIADFVPVTKGQPPFGQYLNVLPLLGVLVPLAFHVQGLYRLRRGRTRVDDFFAVFVGSILAVVLGLIGTLYYQVYHAPHCLSTPGAGRLRDFPAGLAAVPRPSTSSSPTRHESSCARRSSGDGAPASG